MSKRPHRLLPILAAALVVFGLLCPAALAADQPVKNVIFLMTDGTAAGHLTLARWYKGGPLALDGFLVGAVKTHSAESVITDSAAAATAFATGFKSNSGFVGILPAVVSTPGVAAPPEAGKYKPVATVLEGARLAGKAVGLVATANVQHASPAAFSAHTPTRGDYHLIAKQQVYENIDVVLGGGKKYLLPKDQGGSRADGLNLLDTLRGRGYAVAETAADLRRVKSDKVWGLFATDAMHYDIDRKLLAPHEPSLAEMTAKAVEILSRNPNGFFLFVEASKVDWAAHANDPVGVVSDLLAYDAAVAAALDFAAKDGHTLVIACADHGTGGLSIAARLKTDDRTSFGALVPPLRRASLSGEGVAQMLGSDFSPGAIRFALQEYYGIGDLTDAELTKLEKAGRGFARAIGPLLSARSAVGWVYGGHTGDDVFLYAYGPGRPVGLHDNTDVARLIARGLGFDLAAVGEKLFVPAASLGQHPGVTVTLETAANGGQSLVVGRGFKRAVLPVDTNLAILGATTCELPGITVHIAATGQTYIPARAAELVRAYLGL